MTNQYNSILHFSLSNNDVSRSSAPSPTKTSTATLNMRLSTARPAAATNGGVTGKAPATGTAARRSTASFMKPTAASGAKKLSSTAAFAEDLAAAGARGSPAVTRYGMLWK